MQFYTIKKPLNSNRYNQMRKWPVNWEKILYIWQWLIYRIYKELKIINRRNQITQSINGMLKWTDNSQRWNTHGQKIWKMVNFTSTGIIGSYFTVHVCEIVTEYIKGKQRFLLSLVRMAVIKKTNTWCWWCEQQGSIVYHYWKWKFVQSLWKSV